MGKKGFWWGGKIVVNVLKFSAIGLQYTEAKVILILKKKKVYKGVPSKTCYSIESSQRLKARIRF
jgi:hypothetical protein